jgi:diguanylate cyclase (GGDEF)-like protein
MKEVLRHKTFIDEVTGVFNYRYLDLRLAEEAERTRRHGGFTALLYLDLDGFKQVNDRFGHQVGNIVLEELGTAMSQSMRSCDVFGRIGGDEFLAVLPQTDRREAYVLAERIRQKVSDYSLEVGNAQQVDSLTASIGIAAFPVNGESMDNVITAADNAVYAAKQQGGDRVAMADEFVSSDVLGEDIMESVRGEEGAEPS